jgi:hypothetical protein
MDPHPHKATWAENTIITERRQKCGHLHFTLWSVVSLAKVITFSTLLHIHDDVI